MKLKGDLTRDKKTGDLEGRIYAESDDGEPLGFERSGNFSKESTQERFIKSCSEWTGQSKDVVRRLFTKVIQSAQVQLGMGGTGSVSSSIEGKKETPDLPTIRLNARHGREITADALDALKTANREGLKVFTRGGALVRLREEGPTVVVDPFSRQALKGLLARVADFVRIGTGGEERPTWPPDVVVEDILSQPSLPFPSLRSISGIPVTVPGGRVLGDAGYDSQSGVYRYHNNLGPIGQLSVNGARDLLVKELLGDFPFHDQGSCANTVGMILQPFVRPVIDGVTPLFLIDGPTPGTGKGLLANVVSHIAMGHPAEVTVQPRDDDEMRKRITGLLLGSAEMILFDNLRVLQSETLSAALTTRYWKDRILGRQEMLLIENSSLWVATGNNVRLSREMARRVALIRLDPEVENPELRDGFRHPALIEWVQQNRSALVGACVELIQAWVKAGRPKAKLAMGTFEAWAGIIGGVLQVAGIPGFLSNRRELYEGSERDTEEWRAFCQEWAEEYGRETVTAKDLLELAVKKELLLDVRARRSSLAAQQRMGHVLSDRRDRIFDRWAIRSAGRDGVTKSQAYALEPIGSDPCVCPLDEQAEALAGRCPDCGGTRGAGK